MTSPAGTSHDFDNLRDAILRGVAHALSNRVAALGGIAGLADPGQVWTERLSKALHDEGRRLEDILRLLRLVPDDDRAAPGAVELQPLIPDVVALHAYDSSLLQVECLTEYDRETMPVYANRPRLVHTLLLIIDAAKRHAHPNGRVTVRYSGDNEWVVVRVNSEPAANAGTASPSLPDDGDLATAAAALNAAVARVGGDPQIAMTREGHTLRIDLTIPTLAAGRRSEREAKASRHS